MKCKTIDGCLVESILGAKLFQSKAMSRGLRLENKVLSRQIKKNVFKAEIYLRKNSFNRSSPHAVNEDFVVEIKSF